MNYRQKSVIFLATGFYIGKIPFAPGTFGSIIGLPLCFFLSKIELPIAVLCTLVFILIAILIAHDAEKILNKNDPGCIVIDEIAGIIVTLLGMPFNLITVTAGFFIFRIMDIFKPFPIRVLEKRLTGGTGIVLDDVAAGIFGNLALRAMLLLT